MAKTTHHDWKQTRGMRPARARGRRSGFALVVSLALMGFIVLLLISLSSLTMIESRLAGLSHVQLEARENARLGLLLALGELQGALGPDQRVSARADVTGNTAVQKYWTGVWKSVPPAEVPDTAQPVAPLNAGLSSNEDNRLNPSSPLLLSWLVSGNEGLDLSAGGAARFDPTQDLTADYGQGIATPGIYLLGAATLIGEGADEELTADLAGAVAAPKVEIKSGDDVVLGHYAWWVGDEGVKARVRVEETPAVVNAGDDENEALGFQLPVAAEPAAMDSLAFWDRTQARLEDASGAAGLALALQADATERALINERWHDLSTVSRGLLTDTRWGGLRGDLTLAFENEAVFDRYFNTADSTFYFVDTGEFGYSAGFPNWSILQDFYSQKDRVGADGSIASQMPQPLGSSGSVYARSGGLPYVNSGNQSEESYQVNSPVFPVVSRLQVTIGMYMESLGADPADPTTTLYSPVLLIKPLTGFYNPYNITITNAPGSGGATVRNQIRWEFLPLLTLKVYDKDGNPKAVGTIDPAAGVRFRLREVLTGNNNVAATPARDLTFTHPIVMELQPGETRLYGLWRDVNRSKFDASLYVSVSTASLEEDAYSPMSGYFVLPLQSSWDSTKVGPDAARHNDSNPSDSPKFGLNPEEKEYLKLKADDRVELSLDVDSAGDLWFMYNRKPAGYKTANNHVQFFEEMAKVSAVSGGSIARQFEVAEAIASTPEGAPLSDLFDWGMWLRSVGDVYAQDRLLVDHNIRTMGSPQPWDEISDVFYMPSVFTGELDGTQYYGYLPTSLPDILHIGEAEAGGRFTGLWGGSTTNASGGVDRVVLFDVPRTPLVSLGGLQHANIGRYTMDPSYAIGNSFVPARIDALSNAYRRGYLRDGADIWDLSYILNQQLWDSYYFSGIPASLSQAELGEVAAGTQHFANHRLSLSGATGAITPDDLTDTGADADTFYGAASHLMVEGAFNINSTSVEAWQALLSSSKGLRIPVYSLRGDNAGAAPSFQSESKAAFSRLLNPVDDSFEGGGSETFWRGYRALDDDEIAALAKRIVALIKERGKPFASLADFVNRPLEVASDGSGRAGLLQEAIDSSGLNASIPGRTINGAATPPGVSSHDAFNGADAATAFPGYLTQADMLQTLGPVLSARSDTFTIRSYGDSVNRLTGEVEAQVWCEAVVQRVPDETLENADPLSRTANRRFRIVSFRWLSRDEV